MFFNTAVASFISLNLKQEMEGRYVGQMMNSAIADPFWAYGRRLPMSGNSIMQSSRGELHVALFLHSDV